MEIFILALYALVLLLLSIHNISRLSLIVSFLRHRNKQFTNALPAASAIDVDLPLITVQLPVYNELYVAERLIDAVAALKYPSSKLEIQVLDDSNDETIDIIAQRVSYYQDLGYNIHHIRHSQRTGFKAGALAYGLEQAKGEYIAIFDADFVPYPDFLLNVIPNFQDPDIGIVQTRWEHLNKDFSLLTQLQAFGLDAHFTVEQSGRYVGKYFANFNGTGGVWRKAAITDAGGWQSNTLTEDLDLSYRAQIQGWKFSYREDVGTPAELPVEMTALKSQQYRWLKGTAECAHKLTGQVIRQRGLPVGIKFHALMHLFSNQIVLLVLMLGLLSVPLLTIRSYLQWDITLFETSFFVLNLLTLLLFYSIPPFVCKSQKKALVGWHFFMFSVLMMGLSFHNTIAIIEGYLNRKTPFVRTPKFNINKTGDQWQANKYIVPRFSWLTALEGLLALYFMSGLALAFYLDDFHLLPLHSMLTIGFGWVFFLSVSHTVSAYRMVLLQQSTLDTPLVTPQEAISVQ